MQKLNSGFTLLEIIMVISIIAVLAGVTAIRASDVRDIAKETAAMAQIQELTLAVRMYRATTNTYPSSCRITCTYDLDPMQNPLGVANWSGPYFVISGSVHPWGGHIGIEDGVDVTGDAVPDFIIVLDDDQPGNDYNNNQGAIPIASLEWLDAELDDGNLETGNVVGNGAFTTGVGELAIKL